MAWGGPQREAPAARGAAAHFRREQKLLPAVLRLLVLVVTIGHALPACYALKSLASEHEGKHKVRATVHAALSSFERHLADTPDASDEEEDALARALLER